MKYTICYRRVSTREQERDGHSLMAQYEALNKSCIERGYDNILHIEDAGKSARSLNRPGIKKLLGMIEQNAVERLIVYRFDRLTRKIKDLVYLMTLCNDKEIEVISLTDKSDYSTALGKATIHLMGVFAELEEDLIGERTSFALDEAAAQGMHPKRPIFGFVRGEDKKWHIDPEKAKCVNQIITMIAGGMTRNEVSLFLKEEHPDDRSYWLDFMAVNRIIRDDSYTGIFTFRGKQYNTLPVIIEDMEMLKLARINVRKQAQDQFVNHYYFKNKVQCTCGTVAIQTSGQRYYTYGKKIYYYYRCPLHQKEINQKYLIDAIIPVLELKVSHVVNKKREQAILKQLSSIESKMDRTLENYINNDLDDELYLYTMKGLQKEKDNVLQRIEREIGLLRKSWDLMSDDERYEFVKRYIHHVVVDIPHKILIKVVYNEDI